jgi:thioesterase domain-containing protein
VLGGRQLVLAGWSMGGCIALEMTRAWRAQGHDVDALLLLDTLIPPRGLDEPHDKAQARAAILGMDMLDLEGIEPTDRLRATLDRNLHAFLDYRPEPFDGRVTLLRADEDLPDATALQPAYTASDRGWRARISSVTTEKVGGNHFTLLDDEHADELAAAVLRAVGFEADDHA